MSNSLSTLLLMRDLHIDLNMLLQLLRINLGDCIIADNVVNMDIISLTWASHSSVVTLRCKISSA